MSPIETDELGETTDRDSTATRGKLEQVLQLVLVSRPRHTPSMHLNTHKSKSQEDFHDGREKAERSREHKGGELRRRRRRRRMRRKRREERKEKKKETRKKRKKKKRGKGRTFDEEKGEKSAKKHEKKEEERKERKEVNERKDKTIYGTERSENNPN